MFTIKLQKSGFLVQNMPSDSRPEVQLPLFVRQNISDGCFTVQTSGDCRPAIVPSYWGQYLVLYAYLVFIHFPDFPILSNHFQISQLLHMGGHPVNSNEQQYEVESEGLTRQQRCIHIKQYAVLTRLPQIT